MWGRKVMNLKHRTEYTQAVLSVYLTVFTIAFGAALLGSVINIARGLIDGGSISSALVLLLQQIVLSLAAGLAGGWIMSAILGGGLLILACFAQKKIKVNILSVIILLIFMMPVGLIAATPYAVYSAVKFKIPLKITFESRHSSRKKKKRRQKK